MLALDRALEATLPHLFALLGVAGGDALDEMDPLIRARRTRDAVKSLILRESLNQPLILIFEDLHWIDAESEALLNSMADSLATARILMMVNYRPEYRHNWATRPTTRDCGWTRSARRTPRRAVVGNDRRRRGIEFGQSDVLSNAQRAIRSLSKR